MVSAARSRSRHRKSKSPPRRFEFRIYRINAAADIWWWGVDFMLTRPKSYGTASNLGEAKAALRDMSAGLLHGLAHAAAQKSSSRHGPTSIAVGYRQNKGVIGANRSQELRRRPNARCRDGRIPGGVWTTADEPSRWQM